MLNLNSGFTYLNLSKIHQSVNEPLEPLKDPASSYYTLEPNLSTNISKKIINNKKLCSMYKHVQYDKWWGEQEREDNRSTSIHVG